MRICTDCGLPAAKGVRGTIERIEANDQNFLENLGHKISAVRNEIVAQLEQFCYLEIALGDTGLFDPTDYLFGKNVHDNFQTSQYDISEAGKCLALDRGTATVMHLMRALEPALLAMAKEVNYTPSRDEWGGIIEQIEKRLNPQDSQYIQDRDKKEFLSPCAAQFRYFKDAWRNQAMHSREKYTPDEARTVYAAVRSFMMHLAKRIKE